MLSHVSVIFEMLIVMLIRQWMKPPNVDYISRILQSPPIHQANLCHVKDDRVP